MCPFCHRHLHLNLCFVVLANDLHLVRPLFSFVFLNLFSCIVDDCLHKVMVVWTAEFLRRSVCTKFLCVFLVHSPTAILSHCRLEWKRCLQGNKEVTDYNHGWDMMCEALLFGTMHVCAQNVCNDGVKLWSGRCSSGAVNGVQQ